MATSKQVVLSPSTTTELISNTTTDKMLEVSIRTGEDIWIGGTGVTVADGFKVEAFETEKIVLPPSDVLYACSLEGARVYILSTELLLEAPTTV